MNTKKFETKKETRNYNTPAKKRKMFWLKFEITSAILLIAVGAESYQFWKFSIEIEPDISFANAQVVVKSPENKPDILTYTIQQAKKAGLDPVNLLRIINCESGFNPEAVGVNKGSVDIGFVQINNVAHPEVPIEDRLDPYKSVDWMIKTRLQDKNYHQWACSKKLNILK